MLPPVGKMNFQTSVNTKQRRRQLKEEKREKMKKRPSNCQEALVDAVIAVIFYLSEGVLVNSMLCKLENHISIGTLVHSCG